MGPNICELRKFVYQYPMSPVYTTLGILGLVFTWPIFTGFYAYLILDREDYIDFKAQHDAITLDRARYGSNLYIPFFASNKSMDTFEFYKRRTEQRRAEKRAQNEAN
uniref:Uncharacterized protein n=1 Tax=Bursaphelenchus xylophilus TaxID=6326 RepID=A0A1I7SUC5_BURXY